jgi:hypothetical protein
MTRLSVTSALISLICMPSAFAADYGCRYEYEYKVAGDVGPVLEKRPVKMPEAGSAGKVTVFADLDTKIYVSYYIDGMADVSIENNDTSSSVVVGPRAAARFDKSGQNTLFDMSKWGSGRVVCGPGN